MKWCNMRLPQETHSADTHWERWQAQIWTPMPCWIVTEPEMCLSSKLSSIILYAVWSCVSYLPNQGISKANSRSLACTHADLREILNLWRMLQKQYYIFYGNPIFFITFCIYLSCGYCICYFADANCAWKTKAHKIWWITHKKANKPNPRDKSKNIDLAPRPHLTLKCDSSS